MGYTMHEINDELVEHGHIMHGDPGHSEVGDTRIVIQTHVWQGIIEINSLWLILCAYFGVCVNVPVENKDSFIKLTLPLVAAKQRHVRVTQSLTKHPSYTSSDIFNHNLKEEDTTTDRFGGPTSSDAVDK